MYGGVRGGLVSVVEEDVGQLRLEHELRVLALLGGEEPWQLGAVNVYIYVFICVLIYVYIYIYLSLSLSLSIYIYIYMYTHTHT